VVIGGRDVGTSWDEAVGLSICRTCCIDIVFDTRQLMQATEPELNSIGLQMTKKKLKKLKN